MRNNISTLPHELIQEILLRLPVRSLLRFKCVCKSWLSLISDPQFAISHFDLAASPSHRLLLREYCEGFIESRDIEASLYDHDSAVVNLLIPPDYGFLYERYGILGSCRGIVLLYYRSDHLVLWNPSTGAHKPISETKFDLWYSTLYGFGYDASTDDYFVVLVYLAAVEPGGSHLPTRVVFSSLKTNSRNYINYIDNQFENIGYEYSSGSFLNGAIHWLVFSEDEYVHVIIAFDWIEKSFTKIPVPDDLSEKQRYDVHSLRIMGGCLSLCCWHEDSVLTEIWVMKEYKVQSSWTKLVAVSCIYDFSPICITKYGIILGSNYRGRCERLEKHTDNGDPLESVICARDREELYAFSLQSAMYRESLLSPPPDFMKTSIDDQQ